MEFSSFDVSRIASVFFDSAGERCWTKAWFSGRNKGEPSIEITRQQAIAFINRTISVDSWLTRYFPKQMSIVSNAIDKTRQDLLSY